MKWSWSVVVGLCVLTGCGPDYDALSKQAALEYLEHLEPARKPPPLSVTPEAVRFPRTAVGQPATSFVVLRNAGETRMRVYLGIPEPFTVAYTSLNLLPGENYTVDLRLEPATPGSTSAVLLLQTEEQWIEVLVSGEVDPAPPPTGSAAR